MTTKRSALTSILITALVVTVIDGSDAVIYTMVRGRAPDFVFQFIASVALGKQSYEMAPWSTILGILMHCGVALTLTSIYFALAGPIEKVTRNWFLSGFLYGLATYIVINQVAFPVIGVTKWGAMPAWPGLLNGVGAHIFLVGIPIAFGAARHRAGMKSDSAG